MVVRIWLYIVFIYVIINLFIIIAFSMSSLCCESSLQMIITSLAGNFFKIKDLLLFKLSSYLEQK